MHFGEAGLEDARPQPEGCGIVFSGCHTLQGVVLYTTQDAVDAGRRLPLPMAPASLY
jgi:hypothetical protein